MTAIDLFQPNDGQTVNISYTSSGTSAQVALPTRASNGNETIRVYNNLAVVAYIKFGTSSSVTATASADIPIPSLGVEAFSCPVGITNVAAIPASSTSGNIYFTIGKGS